jgi:predicted O-methyltransferase YrrM
MRDVFDSADVRDAWHTEALYRVRYTLARRKHCRACGPRVQVFCQDDFDFLQAVSRRLRYNRAPTFLDAGANIGGASVLFAIAARLAGRVVAVEANPATHAHLARTMRQLGCARLCSGVHASVEAVASRALRRFAIVASV